MSVPPNSAAITGEPLSTVNRVLEVGASLAQVGKGLYGMGQLHRVSYILMVKLQDSAPVKSVCAHL